MDGKEGNKQGRVVYCHVRLPFCEHRNRTDDVICSILSSLSLGCVILLARVVSSFWPGLCHLIGHYPSFQHCCLLCEEEMTGIASP